MGNRDSNFAEICCKKEYNIFFIKKIKECFDEALKSGEYLKIFQSMQGLDEELFVMTGEYSRILNLVKILVEEMQGKSNSLFFQGTACFDELYDKYLRTILMLRRLELYGDEDFAELAYAYFAINRLSSFALKVFLDKEYFENKHAIVTKLFSFYLADLDEKEKNDWKNNFAYYF